MRLIEVSHLIEPGMTTYPGLPVPREELLLTHESSRGRYAEGVEFHIAGLHLCGNTGTYVDSPFHRYRDGADLSELPLEKVAYLDTVRLSTPDHAIGPDLFRGHSLAGKAVLIETGFSRHWRTDRYLSDNPHLTADACYALLDAGVAFVGIDSLNIDALTNLHRPAHSLLLGAGIPICEHMTNLAAVPAEGGVLHAAPIAWKGGATFPVRAYVAIL